MSYTLSMKVIREPEENTIYKYSDVMYSLCKNCDGEIEAGQSYHTDCAKLLREEEESHRMLIKQAKLAKHSETMSRLWREKKCYNRL